MATKKPADNKDLALVQADELSLVENNMLNEKQLQFILRRTPTQYIKQRVVGEKSFSYVTGGYIKKCLNLMWGWNWSFEIISEQVIEGHVVVKGKLTCADGKIVKMQYGSKEIEKDKDGKAIDIGFDFKAAATDCLKKCASEIGIAADIYNSEDFREVHLAEKKDLYDDIKALYDQKKDKVLPDDQVHVERILKNRETHSYTKVKEKLELL